MLTPIEHATLIAIVGLNDGATAEKIGKRIKHATGRALAGRELVALLAGLVARGMLSVYTVAALVPAYSLTAQGVAALDTPPESTQHAPVAQEQGVSHLRKDYGSSLLLRTTLPELLKLLLQLRQLFIGAVL